MGSLLNRQRTLPAIREARRLSKGEVAQMVRAYAVFIRFFCGSQVRVLPFPTNQTHQVPIANHRGYVEGVVAYISLAWSERGL